MRAAVTSDDAPLDRAALVRRAQRGDGDAFGQLAQHYGRAVYAIALAHLGRPVDAEDVAQTVLLAALENIESCRDPERFDAWILTIARNRARRALVRRRLRDVLARPPSDLPERGPPTDTVRRRVLERALASLSPRQREAVLLHDLHGYTHAELADALCMSEEASRQHLARARRQLRSRLEEAE